ncbi:hypothetical protein [Solimonas terrae]|uniref:Uncharacterized protein n=1 Tax=Solimonas terrae TaxID=1396819 RepID=A0A6M2BT82_9GAMM|nr:hypothetical protein [Solimonas terrae]NGY05564.1 hypothetical protein [Solimonas terrae]
MAIVNRRAKAKVAAPLPAETENFAFAAEIPVGEREPLWKLQLQVHSTPQADGEHTRLRAHLQTNLGSALRPALARSAPDVAALPRPDPSSATSARALRLAERAGHAAQNLAQRALRVPVLRRLAEPLLQLDFNTWIEIQASTASLDRGSHSLLPQAERLHTLGIRPRRAGDEPLAETWAGEAPDGYAQVSVLQIDKRHLPERLLRLLGNRPFGLAATIVNTVQQKKAQGH